MKSLLLDFCTLLLLGSGEADNNVFDCIGDAIVPRFVGMIILGATIKASVEDTNARAAAKENFILDLICRWSKMKKDPIL